MIFLICPSRQVVLPLALLEMLGRVDEQDIIGLLALLQDEDADRDAGRVEQIRQKADDGVDVPVVKELAATSPSFQYGVGLAWTGSLFYLKCNRGNSSGTYLWSLGLTGSPTEIGIYEGVSQTDRGLAWLNDTLYQGDNPVARICKHFLRSGNRPF